MAVGQSGEFGQDIVPPVSMSLAPHRQLERGFASRPAPHRRPAKQAPAQSVQFAFFQLAQAPLQQHAQVVGGDGQMMHRLGAPEIAHAQPFARPCAIKTRIQSNDAASQRDRWLQEQRQNAPSG